MAKQTDQISSRVIAAIVATGLMSFCGVIVETSMNIAFPTLMREFNVSTNIVQWMTSTYLLAISIVVPFSAALKARFKTRSLFLFANFCFLVGLVVDALAPVFLLLLIGRVIQGIGTGIALPLMFNIILEQVPRSCVGTMMGVGNMITGIAPAIGPTFGGIVIQELGWRWVFYFLIPLIVLSLFLGLWGIQQKSVLRKVKLDLISFLTIACFFMGVILGFSNLGSGKLEFIFGPILIGLVGLAFLLWRSIKIKQPIIDFRLFKNGRFSAHVLGFLLIQLISLGNAFLLPNYIQLVNGNTALVAGLVVLPAGFAGAIMGPVGGRLLDHHGARRPILAGTLMMILELIVFSLSTPVLSNWLITFVYVIYMAGMGMILGDVMTDTLAGVRQSKAAQGNAILNTVQQFAGAIGTSITSAIVTASQNEFNSKGPMPTTIGTQHAFLFLLVLGMIIFLLFFKSVQPEKR